ncbi:FAD-dependent oxidoreductase [Paenibacillus oryzisoli]|uniref:FAD-dependent oxidoreductase n=1 Tax=Paenibacillus oryzisoli TaxID=1850517 RepID=UPI003D285ABF
MNESYEVVVYGATPGGIGAAIAAARQGRSTLLIEPGDHIGGLMTSGLGRTDIISLDASGALFREFADKVLRYYVERFGEGSSEVQACNGGLFFEPSVAMRVLREILDQEVKLAIVCRQELDSVIVRGNQLEQIVVRSDADGKKFSIRAAVFIDGTYEGDLAAASGVPYRIGRESRDEWNEEYAGKLYMNFDDNKEVFPGSTGEGDHRIQAYNYRLCLTDRDDNRVPVTKPDPYIRGDYVSLLEDVSAGRVRSIGDVLNMLPIPGGKTDSNNHHFCMCSSDLPEENDDYPTGTRETRRSIEHRHRSYVQGLLWFLQHDEALPESFRAGALRWGYAADEFIDNGHFPPQLYVREARRIEGEYTFTENDARIAPGFRRAPIQADSIAVGAYPIDSHATRKREPAGNNVALEGFLGIGWLTEIYQIPYGVIVPKEVDGLLVPVAVSATHMGLGTIRMEPCWMQLGFAAGIAADMSVSADIPVRLLNIDLLQDRLLSEAQLITYYQDTPLASEIGRACQYFGTKGFFESYEAGADKPASVREAAALIALSRLLPGGSALPALPASDQILAVGIDMGPRLPCSEELPVAYWERQPLLQASMLRRWMDRAIAALGLPQEAAITIETPIVTRGELCLCLYRLLRLNRQKIGKVPPNF